MGKDVLTEIVELLKKESDDYRALAQQQKEAGELDNAADYRRRAELCFEASTTLKEKAALLVPRQSVAIEAEVNGDYLVVPQGMTPIYAHTLGSRMIVYVEGWTAEKEYDQNRYELYPLSAAQIDVVPFKNEGVESKQTWYTKFGSPVKIAMKDSDATLLVHDL